MESIELFAKEKMSFYCTEVQRNSVDIAKDLFAESVVAEIDRIWYSFHY